MTPFDRPCLSARVNEWTYRYQFRLHERVVDVSGREEDNGESDENIFVCVVQSVGIVPVASMSGFSCGISYLPRQELDVICHVFEEVFGKHAEVLRRLFR